MLYSNLKYERCEKMGNLIKINMYSEKKLKKNKYTNIEILESNFVNYNKWLEENDKIDLVENYATFLKMLG